MEALVLGASGGIGGEVARLLVARGWQVRALNRAPKQGDGLQWLVGDAMNRETWCAQRKAPAGAHVKRTSAGRVGKRTAYAPGRRGPPHAGRVGLPYIRGSPVLLLTAMVLPGGVLICTRCCTPR